VDLPVGVGPVLLAEFALEDLAGPGHGQRVDELDAAWCLVRRDQRLDVVAESLFMNLSGRVVGS